MSAIETDAKRFECRQLGGAAIVQINYASRDGRRLGAGEVGNCDGAKICGVATPSPNGQSWSFDWSKCVHPMVRKSR